MLATTLTWGLTPREHFSLASRIVGIDSLASPDALSTALPKLFPAPGSRQPDGFFAALEVYHNMVFINLMWGLVNLLPILPLDGGRVASILLSLYDRSRGQRWSYIVSLLTAGILAVYVLTRPGQPSIFLLVFFGSLALMNYQSLQAIHQSQIFSSDDDDWWRR